VEFREQLLQIVNGFVRVDAVGFECSGSAAIEVGAENVNETGSRKSFPTFHDPDFRSKFPRQFDKLGGWPRV
jgi:hypothetical protein